MEPATRSTLSRRAQILKTQLETLNVSLEHKERSFTDLVTRRDRLQQELEEIEKDLALPAVDNTEPLASLRSDVSVVGIGEVIAMLEGAATKLEKMSVKNVHSLFIRRLRETADILERAKQEPPLTTGSEIRVALADAATEIDSLAAYVYGLDVPLRLRQFTSQLSGLSMARWEPKR